MQTVFFVLGRIFSGVVFDHRQIRQKLGIVLFVESADDFCVGLINNVVNLAPELLALFTEINGNTAAVFLTVYPADQILFFQSAKDTGNGRSVKMHGLSQLRGGQTIMLPKTTKKFVLGRGGVVILESTLEIIVHRILRVRQNEIDTIVAFHVSSPQKCIKRRIKSSFGNLLSVNVRISDKRTLCQEVYVVRKSYDRIKDINEKFLEKIRQMILTNN